MTFQCTNGCGPLTVLRGSDADTIKLRCPKCGTVSVAKPFTPKQRR